jgi:hypothetical protein
MREWRKKNPDKVRAINKRFQSSEKGKAAERRRWKNPKRIEAQKRYRAKYRTGEACKAARRRYKKGASGRAAELRYKRGKSGKAAHERFIKRIRNDPNRLAKYRATSARCVRNQRQRDMNFRLRSGLRTLLRQSLKAQRSRKTNSVIKLLGCSIDSFKIHLESLWQPNMSWQNYGRGQGQWSLDHIIPLALFDLTKLEHQERAFHFSNCQPMWHVENIRKGKRCTDNQFRLL